MDFFKAVTIKIKLARVKHGQFLNLILINLELLYMWMLLFLYLYACPQNALLKPKIANIWPLLLTKTAITYGSANTYTFVSTCVRMMGEKWYLIIVLIFIFVINSEV